MRAGMEKIFGSRIRAKILGWFFTHTDESFFVRQIASILKEDPTNVSREMANLEELGILRSGRNGNLKLFQASPDCPFFKELKGLVLKTTGVAGQIRTAIEKFPGIDYAFIYGSYAKGDERHNSDVDILIIGDVNLDRLDSLLRRVENQLGRELNYVLYNMEEFQSKKVARDGFLMDILADKKIMLIGNENGLEAPRGTRLDRKGKR
jgi:predicted nucleotidyltransferase